MIIIDILVKNAKAEICRINREPTYHGKSDFANVVDIRNLLLGAFNMAYDAWNEKEYKEYERAVGAIDKLLAESILDCSCYYPGESEAGNDE